MPSFSARARELSVRLLRAPEGFVDRLGLAELEGQIRAQRDEELSLKIGDGMAALRRRLE